MRLGQICSLIVESLGCYNNQTEIEKPTFFQAGMPQALRYLLASERVRNNLPGNWQHLLDIKLPGDLAVVTCVEEGRVITDPNCLYIILKHISKGAAWGYEQFSKKNPWSSSKRLCKKQAQTCRKCPSPKRGEMEKAADTPERELKKSQPWNRSQRMSRRSCGMWWGLWIMQRRSTISTLGLFKMCCCCFVLFFGCVETAINFSEEQEEFAASVDEPGAHISVARLHYKQTFVWFRLCFGFGRIVEVKSFSAGLTEFMVPSLRKCECVIYDIYLCSQCFFTKQFGRPLIWLRWTSLQPTSKQQLASIMLQLWPLGVWNNEGWTYLNQICSTESYFFFTGTT